MGRSIVVGSCFRNSSQAHIDRYAEQIRALHTLAQDRGDTLSLISVWGDCDDDTPGRLGYALSRLRLASWSLIERSHGVPEMGSTEHPERIRGFAYAANGVFEHIRQDADVVVYVESDLIWEAATIYRLIDQVDLLHPIIAPPTFTTPDTFYDVFAFRTPDGRHFGPFAPWWDELNLDGLTEVGSVGGCVVLRGIDACFLRCSPEEALVGLCRQARELGIRVFTDWRERVWHP